MNSSPVGAAVSAGKIRSPLRGLGIVDRESGGSLLLRNAVHFAGTLPSVAPRLLAFGPFRAKSKLTPCTHVVSPREQEKSPAPTTQKPQRNTLADLAAPPVVNMQTALAQFAPKGQNANSRG
jgi:hypothetical protein